MFTKLVIIKFLNEPDSVLYDTTDGFVSDRYSYDFQYVIQGKRSIAEKKTIEENVPCLHFSISDEPTLIQYINGFKKLTDRYKKFIQIEINDEIYNRKNHDNWQLTETAVIHKSRLLHFSTYAELVAWIDYMEKK